MRETPQKSGVEAAWVALRITGTLQGAVTEMVKGHLRLSPRSLQIKGTPKGTGVKQDLTRSPRLHTEMLHNLTEMTVKTSGHTGEVLVSKQKVPMGHTATSLLVVITSLYLEEVQPMGAKDSLPVPRITVGMQTCMGHTVCRSHPVRIQATKESDPLPALPTGAGPRAMADTVRTNKESLGQVLMETAGDHEVLTESP